MMRDSFDRLQSALLSDPQQWHSAIKAIETTQYQLGDVELAKSRICLRLLKAAYVFHNQESHASHGDLLVLIRQVVRLFGSLELPTEWWESICENSRSFGLQEHTLRQSGTVRITALQWNTDWLPDAEDIDRLIMRRQVEQVLGDGMLLDFMEVGGKDITTYLTEGQRQAAWAAMFAPPGSTTLITLPTGAGKSLTVQLAAWVDSKHGTYAGGTTIVIVPTIALAIDQNEAARQHFRNPNPAYLPHYLASDVSEELRNLIRTGVREGTMPLLFISPESLIGSEFSGIVMKAAKEGKIKRIVVDEAHLIESWGASFRSDFQFLSTYLRILYNASRQQLRLLMLSATISAGALATLKQLFTLPSGKFSHVQVNQLRPEIGYWMANASSESQKLNRVAEALRYLPRPSVLYLTAPRDAERYRDELMAKDGYQRVATFTGETSAEKRLQLIQDWRDDRIDLMIATSAFGLGVDKPDVRTILHAAFPESIDRFYQEVGRGGRDGCSSISLVITTKHDRKYAVNNSLKSRITVEKAWPRWHEMFRHARRSESGTWIINRQMTPKGSMEKSDINRDWNEHVLLLMQRAAIIKVADMVSPLSSDLLDQPIDYDELQVSVLQHEAVNDFEGFKTIVDVAREQERGDLIKASQKLASIFRDQTSEVTDCLAYEFEQIYAPVGLACGGCPGCRRAERKPYTTPAELEIVSSVEFDAPHTRHYAELSKLMGHRRTLLVLYDSGHELDFKALKRIASGIIKRGVAQIMLSPAHYREYGNALASYLKADHAPAHMLFSYPQTWIRLFSLPTIVFLTNDDTQSNAVFQRLHKWQEHTGQMIIYVLPRTLRLSGLHGLFIDRVNGHQQDLGRFLNQMHEMDYTL